MGRSEGSRFPACKRELPATVPGGTCAGARRGKIAESVNKAIDTGIFERWHTQNMMIFITFCSKSLASVQSLKTVSNSPNHIRKERNGEQ
jgi:hypothetical protein